MSPTVDARSERLGDDDLVAGLLVLGLAVGDAADLDVEHVDLAVGGEVVAVGADQRRGVEELLRPLDPLGEAAGEQVDAELARPAAGGGRGSARRAARRRRAAPRGPPSRFHFSGSTTSSAPSAAAARTRRSATSRLRSLSPVELSWTAADAH